MTDLNYGSTIRHPDRPKPVLSVEEPNPRDGTQILRITVHSTPGVISVANMWCFEHGGWERVLVEIPLQKPPTRDILLMMMRAFQGRYREGRDKYDRGDWPEVVAGLAKQVNDMQSTPARAPR